MSKNKETSACVDALLLGIATGSILGTMIVAPNAVQLLDTPMGKLSKSLDRRQRERELIRIARYMKTQGLVRGDYSHGIELTKKALKRIKRRAVIDLCVSIPDAWDNTWRLVMFDIPEEQKKQRVAFTHSLRGLGFQILQQSVWIHPYPCKEELYVAAQFFGVAEWVTYIETNHIDNGRDLKLRFKHLLG